MEPNYQTANTEVPLPAPTEPIPRIYMTSREIEVVQLLVRGQSNAEIATQLGIQLQTVKNLLSALYAKLGVSTRLQLVLLALRTGFVA